MRAISAIILLALLAIPTGVTAEVQTFTATHTYILGDHDSKDDARQRCLLEAKRKVLEQAGVLIESASEVKDFQLSKDKITSFATAVMQVRDTKEDFGFENGHNKLTLTLTARVDLAEVRKQLAARQVDGGVRDEVAAQRERIKRLEAQLEAMQKQIRQDGQAPAQALPPQASDLSAEEIQRLKTQAAQGDAMAQVELGLRYVLGQGAPQDYVRARQWYEKAAAQGDAQAQSNLGVLYHNGQGVLQDYGKAQQWYEKAAAQGNASAQFNLGLLYHNGQGVPQDYGKARQWWEQAAAQGNASAQSNLGLLYHNGQGVPQDYGKARQWYEQADAQELASAQTNLGLLYDKGHGVPQDYATARQWYEKAAAQGDASAQTNLGTLYYKGNGVPQDYGKARQLFEQAAAQGDAFAQAKLGLLYDKGHGVPQDYIRAYMWYNLAAASTGKMQEDAAYSRDFIARRLTPTQLAEAQRLTQQCQARQFKSC